MKHSTEFVFVLLTALTFSCGERVKEQAEKKENHQTTSAPSPSPIERGRYLVEAMGCEDCHSPKQMGANGPELIEDLRFSGYPANRPLGEPDPSVLKKGWVLMGADLTTAVGPWGQSFAANISSDPTGIGNWTEETFITCIRTGKSKGLASGRPMLPPMPWMSIAKLSDEDLRAIFAYLQSTKPVANVVPANRPITM